MLYTTYNIYNIYYICCLYNYAFVHIFLRYHKFLEFIFFQWLEQFDKLPAIVAILLASEGPFFCKEGPHCLHFFQEIIGPENPLPLALNNFSFKKKYLQSVPIQPTKD